jgi:DNA-binding beta-propeller fold protein YncE
MTTVSTPLGSQFIAANLVTDRVYSAGCDFSTTGVCTVTVIDGTSNTVIATIPLNGSNGIGLQGITIDPIRNVIYVSDDMNYEVAVINGDTNAVTYINTGNTEMLGLSFDFATNLIVGTPSGAVVDLIAGATHQIKQVPVGTINEDVAVDSFTSRAYVTDNAGTTLGVVDLRKGRVVTTIPVGSAPSWVCADYLSNLVFVIVGNSVVVVDGEINKATGSIAFNSSYLSDVDVNPATRLVYVSDLTNSVVHVLTE